MRISLSSPNRRFTFLAICALFVVVLWALSWQALLEYWFSRSDTVEGLQRAARIQPLNAGTYEVLGAASLTGLEADFHRSISYFQKAAALNPHSARAWMGIAELHNILGNHDLEIQAA